MAVDIVHADAAKRVPAWKRIGLKLKYAKDTADDDKIVQKNEPEKTFHQSLMKRSGPEPSHQKQPKRRKAERSHDHFEPASSHGPNSIGLGISGHESDVLGDFGHAPSHGAIEDGAVTPKTKISEKSRRKSVTFTPDTKQEDGFSAARIFKSHPPSGQNNPAAIGTEDTADGAVDESSSTTTPIKGEKGKKKKKKRKNSASEESTNSSKLKQSNAEEASAGKSTTPAYVQYLEQYHNDRDHWKFNTSKQKLLLKNIWNIYRIPPKYNAALVEYISGLRSANSRRGLAREGQESLKTWYEADPDNTKEIAMLSFEARKAAYQDALRRRLEQHAALGGRYSEYDEQQLEVFRQENERASRCLEVCYQALMQELHPDQISVPSPSAESTSATVSQDQTSELSQTSRRKRKSRTDVSSSEESSSSSESESDSDSESEASPAKKRAGTRTKEVAPGPFDENLLDSFFGPKTVPAWKVKSQAPPSSSRDEDTSDEPSDSTDDDDDDDDDNEEDADTSASPEESADDSSLSSSSSSSSSDSESA